MLIFAQNLRTT